MSNRDLPKVLVVSVPKGGTNLLTQVILGIPGMVQIRHNMIVAGSSPLSRGEMGVMHLPHSREAEKLLADNQVKVIFIHRDLRDIAVSMMHFIATSLPSHILYPSFQNILISSEQRLATLINGVNVQTQFPDTVVANEMYVASGLGNYPNIREFWSPFKGWVVHPSVCQVTYEELFIASPKRTAALYRIVNFLWDDLNNLGIPKGLLVSQMEQNINPLMSPTFRAGRIGDWKSEFTSAHKQDFKRIAGQTLIDLGYEHDFNW